MSDSARRRIDAKWGDVHLSAASVWEMAIKTALGKLSLDLPLRAYVEERVEAGLRILPVEWRHAAAVADLPPHHGDLFDRLIVAQALAEKMPVVTNDPAFRPYGVKTLW